MKKACALLAIFMFCFCNIWAAAPWGEVLPKGKSWLLFYYVGTWASQVYDNNGNKVDARFGASGKESYEVANYAYGVTDDISVGIEVPYAYRYISFTNQLMPSQEGTGLGDIKVGGQYRYINTEYTSLAGRAAVKFPTGKVDDPKDPRDLDIGTGQAYIELDNYIDHYLSDKNWIVSGQLRINIQLEGQYNTPSSYVALAGSTYKKDPGDELWLAAGLERKNILTPGLSASMRVEERLDDEDNYYSQSAVFNNLLKSANLGDPGQLLFIQPEIKYSAFKTWKLPLRVYFNYRVPISGKNNYALTRIESGMDIFF